MPAPDVVGRAEVADLLGVTPARAGTITRRRTFPAPCTHLILGRVWRRVDVEAWIAEHWTTGTPKA